MKILINLVMLWAVTGIATFALAILIPSIGVSIVAMFAVISLISLLSIAMGFLVYAILTLIVVIVFGKDN